MDPSNSLVKPMDLPQSNVFKSKKQTIGLERKQKISENKDVFFFLSKFTKIHP